jgi:hypothetical protein
MLLHLELLRQSRGTYGLEEMAKNLNLAFVDRRVLFLALFDYSSSLWNGNQNLLRAKCDISIIINLEEEELLLETFA